MKTKSTIHYNRWDIILVPFPFTDLSAFKRRPALIISPDEYNKSDDVIISFITSNLSLQERFGDHDILEWRKSGLPKPSIVKMKFATIHKSIVIKKIGKLSDADVMEFQQRIIKFFS